MKESRSPTSTVERPLGEEAPSGQAPAEIREEGRRWLRLQEAPLDLAAALGFLKAPRAGGIGFFAGTTRQWTDTEAGMRETVHLDYDCYRPMALKQLATLAGEAERRWPVLERLVVLHRLGTVPVAEASVVVGAAAPHRDEAFAATRFLIDTLKRQVPIWKRERYADGETAWVEGDAPPALPDDANLNS